MPYCLKQIRPSTTIYAQAGDEITIAVLKPDVSIAEKDGVRFPINNNDWSYERPDKVQAEPVQVEQRVVPQKRSKPDTGTNKMF